MSELLKRVIEEIMNYCKRKQIDVEKTDFLLIVDNVKKFRIKNTFEATSKIEKLMTVKKAHLSVIIFDKKEERPVVGIRFGDDGVWHLEKKSS